MAEGVSAITYHDRTKHTPESVRGGGGLDFENKPRPDKQYTDLPQVGPVGQRHDPSMPALEAITGSTSEGSTGLDRDTLLSLCYHAAGITKTIQRGGREIAFRAASCTGALYHIDLYPVCGPGEDLDSGVYHYDPQADALEQLRAGDYRGVLAEASDHPHVGVAPVTFVATSTWWRNAWKYKARTYRHAFWDSGTVLANLLATATALGWSATTVTGFADMPVATLLGVDPDWEAPLELVPVGGADPAPSPPTVAPVDPATDPLDSDPVAYPLIAAAWQASTLPDGVSAAEWRTQGPRPVDRRGPGDGDRLDLDPVDAATASSRPLANTIERRGSCRAYDRDPVSFRTLSTILDRATRGVPMDVRDDAGPPLQFCDCYCILNDVDGVASGAYQYHPAAGVLERLHTGDTRAAAEHLALDQPLGGDAAVNIYFLADLASVVDALGDRGYRGAQLEAALTAGRLYLGTYAHRDLGGTGLTFFDDEVTAFFEPRAAGQTPMFLYTLGHPA
ncbi:MAG: SagB/ThcOx family dehydrogenase [Halobacteriaceae archaeon]